MIQLYMMIRTKRLLAILLMSLFFFTPNQLLAQTGRGNEGQEVFDDKRGDVSVNQDTLDQAESAFFEGLTAYRAKKYIEAAKRFEAAHKLVPYRDLLFNIARAYEELGDQASAVSYYKQYLATKPIDETQIIHRMRELGVSRFEEPKDVDQPKLKRESPQTASGSTIDPLSVGLLAGGVALLGVGAYFGFDALDQAESARGATVKPRYDEYRGNAESSALLADISMSVGIAALAGGLYLALTDRGVGARQETRINPTAQTNSSLLKWRFTYDTGLRGVSLSGSF